MKRMYSYVLIVVFVILGFSCPALAGEQLLVAVAANFIMPSKEIIDVFQKTTGITIEATYTSTGKLYSQIIGGAPYDVFLAADQKRPELLKTKGLSDEPFIYAHGQVVLWTAKSNLCKAASWQEIVTDKDVKTIAIANTEAAPYGTASMVALQKAGLWEFCKDKFVFPQTIAQAFQYAHTGNTDVGFCAYSSALSEQGQKGCFLKVPEAPDIIQAACILKRTEMRTAAEQFAAFLQSPEARTIKEKYGYK